MPWPDETALSKISIKKGAAHSRLHRESRDGKQGSTSGLRCRRLADGNGINQIIKAKFMSSNLIVKIESDHSATMAQASSYLGKRSYSMVVLGCFNE